MGLYLLYFIVRFPVTSHVHNRSILLTTCVGPLFSSHRCINVFGVFAFVLAIVAALISVTTFVSVWCFLAAVLSVLVYIHFSGAMQACRPLWPVHLAGCP